MIADAEFSIFDITTWNPNVALELGIARGRLGGSGEMPRTTASAAT